MAQQMVWLLVGQVQALKPWLVLEQELGMELLW